MEISEFNHKGTKGVTITVQESESLNEQDFSSISDQINQQNVVLLRGFNLSGGNDFRQFSESIGDRFQSYQGGAFERKSVDGDKTVLEVSGGKTSPVPLHGEMYYISDRPRRLWFYSQTASRQDGETQVCDAREFLLGLSESTRQLLQTNNISYLVTYDDGEWQTIFDCEDLDVVQQYCDTEGMLLKRLEGGGIQTSFTTTPLVENADGLKLFINNIIPILAQEYVLGNSNRVVRLENGTRISPEIFQELIAVSNSLAYNHFWKPADIMIVNNAVMMHGRNKVTDPNRNVLVRLGYQEYTGHANQSDHRLIVQN